MQLTVTQAAKAVKKGRNTLYRHMNDGTLSYTDDGTGKRLIDVSELQRVYQDLSGLEQHGTKRDTLQKDIMEQTVTPENQALKQQIEQLKHQLDVSNQEKQKLLEILEQSQNTIKALTPPKEQKGNWLKRLFS